MSSPIFISHSSLDKDWAYKLITDLEKRGVPCWISSRDIEPGADYQKSIVDALDAAPAMILLFSDHANNSKEIPREMAIASGKSKPMIPVRIEDVVPRNALAYSLTNAQFLDLFANYEGTMTRLTEALLRQMAAKDMPISEAKKAATFEKPAVTQPKTISKPSASSGPNKNTVQKPKSNKAYVGIGAIALIAAAGAGVYAFTSHDDTVRVNTVQSLTPSQAEPNSSKHITAAVPSSQVKQQPVTPSPTPSSSGTHIETTTETPTAGSLDALIEQIKQLNVRDRVDAVQKSPLLENAKLSAAQMISLLNGTANSERRNLIESLIPFTSQPIAISDALKTLNSTGDSWASTVKDLEQALPEKLKDKDILALLGTTTDSNRSSLLNTLSQNAVGPFDMTVVEKILGPMNDNRGNAIRSIVNLLPQPIPENSFRMLLGSISNSERKNTIDALQPALPATLTLNGALQLLANTNDSWDSTLALLSSRLPNNLTANQGAQLLGTTQNSSRANCLEVVAPHLVSGLKGSETEPLLRGLHDSWYKGVNSIVPRLAAGQDNTSVLTLLGMSTDSNRKNIIESLASVLPAKMSVNDAVSILKGTGDSRLPTAIFLLTYLPELSPQDLDSLAGNLSPSAKKNLAAAASR